MSQLLSAKACRWLELDVHLDLEPAPADPRQQEGSFLYSDLAWLERWMKMVCDGLDVLLSLLWIAIQRDEHAPSVRVLGSWLARSGRLWVLDLFVGISKGELYKFHVTEPLAGCLKLCLALFELRSHLLRYLFLQFGVNLGHEELVEVRTAHRASHTCRHDLLVALEAHEVLAGGEHGLRA